MIYKYNIFVSLPSFVFSSKKKFAHIGSNCFALIVASVGEEENIGKQIQYFYSFKVASMSKW